MGRRMGTQPIDRWIGLAWYTLVVLAVLYFLLTGHTLPPQATVP